MNDLDNIKNFGPYMVKIMKLIGIHSREDLKRITIKGIGYSMADQIERQ